jgi:hypothetical protein
MRYDLGALATFALLGKVLSGYTRKDTDNEAGWSKDKRD